METLKQRVCEATGLLPELKPALRLKAINPYVSFGADDDDESLLSKLDLELTGAGESKWHYQRATKLLVVQQPDGRIELLMRHGGRLKAVAGSLGKRGSNARTGVSALHIAAGNQNTGVEQAIFAHMQTMKKEKGYYL